MGSIGSEAKPSWEDTVAQKRRLRADAVAAFSGEKSQNHPILGVYDASRIVGSIVRGEITAKKVAEVFIQRTCDTHELTNCLTEILFGDALKRAEELDVYLAEHGKPIGPLHGVPVTLKDQFDVRGVDTTLGYVGRCFKPATEDAALVKLLKSLGAVIIAKTNLPQSIMWCETDNPLWGLTTYPTRKDYTPGGSTGGEGVLLTCQASLLGWGTDIGGSIRIPAHMTGIYGLKPSSGRLPYRGVPVSTEGQEHVPSSVGPMARCLETIRLTMQSLSDLEPWSLDSRCAPIPWREDQYQETLSRPLVVGVLYDDDHVRPHPPISRVLKNAVEALRAAGHEIVEWNANLHTECIEVMDKYYTVDGGQDIRDDIAVGGEPTIPHVQGLLDAGNPISVYDYWQVNKRKIELQHRYLDKWNSIRSPTSGRPVDVILMPPMPHTAVPHRSCRWVGYTKVWNVLDYPALVIPGGKVSSEDATASWDYEARGPRDEWVKNLWDECKQDMVASMLPVGVQLVGRKLEEEKVLAAGKVLDVLLNGDR